MNKSFIYLSLLTAFALIFFSACKKYKYEYPDAYESGLDQANMPPGQSDSLGKDLSKLAAARIFPGLVGDSEPRLNNVDVSIDFSARYVVNNDIRIVSSPQPMYSTGLYAPTGEPISIEIPQGVNGLVAQIGGWTDNLNDVAATKRDPLIYNQIALQPGKNIIRNLYGGMLYFRTNGTVKEIGTVTLRVSGAVRSPDFILGVSDDAEWNTQVRQSAVPWFQLRGKRIVFELPKQFLDKHPISNPTELVQEWDRIIEEDIYKWKGLEDVTSDSLNKAPNHPIRVIMDIQPRNTYAHNSFPVVMQMDENLFTQEIANYNNLVNKGAWRTLFEIGRNNTTTYWMFNGLTSTAGNLFSVKMANRLQFNLANLHPSMKVAIDTGIWYTKQPKNYASNFNRDLTNRTNGDMIKLLPFIQLFEYYGYGLLNYIEYDARHSTLGGRTDQQKINNFFVKACEFTQTDLSAFFRAWSIPVSAVVTDSIELKYPYMTKTVFWYNPITKTGIVDSLMPKPRELDRTSWSVSGFCCQEATTGKFYASNLLDGELSTLWQTRENHSPHFVTFDMGSAMDVGGFYIVNGSSVFRPRVSKVYVSWDNTNWTTAYSGTIADATGNVQRSLNFTGGLRYVGVRYIRFEVTNSYPTTNTVTTISSSEFGGLRGIVTGTGIQTPVYPEAP